MGNVLALNLFLRVLKIFNNQKRYLCVVSIFCFDEKGGEISTVVGFHF